MLRWRLIAVLLLSSAVCIGVIIAVTGSEDGLVNGQRVIFVGSPEYKLRVKSFALNLKDAQEACDAASAKKRGTPHGWMGSHYFLIGDDYVFSISDKRGMSLNGYYVNGNTGEVRWRPQIACNPDFFTFDFAKRNGYSRQPAASE